MYISHNFKNTMHLLLNVFNLSIRKQPNLSFYNHQILNTSLTEQKYLISFEILLPETLSFSQPPEKSAFFLAI